MKAVNGFLQMKWGVAKAMEGRFIGGVHAKSAPTEGWVRLFMHIINLDGDTDYFAKMHS